MSRAAFLITLVLTVVAVSVFNLNPQFDLWASHLFFDYFGGRFAGAGAEAKFARGFFYTLPIAVCVLFVLARWPGASLGLSKKLVPTNRAVAFVVLSMAVGPGLIVNLGLKDNWHRPRPINVREFGGPQEFRPIWARDGACKKNCSFVSGEASAAFWLVGPASLAPAPYTAPAVIAALGVGVTTSLLRMAFGGHFLSDVALAGLITLLLLQIMYRMIRPGLRDGPP